MKSVLLIFSIAVILVSCDNSANNLKERIAKGNVVLGGTLRLSESEKPVSFLPEELITASAQRIGNQLHCGLLRLDAQSLSPMPAIAERVEPDTSGRVYLFHMRQGVLFHNNPYFETTSREVTARDVVFSFQKLCAANSLAFESTFKGRVVGADAYHEGTETSISGIQVLDDYTLSITLLKPDESFLFVLAQPSTSIISEKAWNNAQQQVVGAGPFVPTQSTSDLVLIRNSDYFQADEMGNQLPYLDSLIFKFIPSKETALEEVLKGKLDLVTGIYLDPVKHLLEQHGEEFKGKEPRLVLQRNDDAASFEVYAIHASKLLGFRENFLGYRDFSLVQMKH